MAWGYDAGFEAGPGGYERSYPGERGPGYGRDPVGYGGDYEPFGGPDVAWRGVARGRRRLLARRDWRFRGGPAGGGPRWPDRVAGGEGSWHEGGWRGRGGSAGGRARPGRTYRGYERREPYPRDERHYRNVPPDYRRYLSEDDYGVGPGRAYDRLFQEDRFRRGPLGPRNALFGGEGFVRYDADFDEQWW